jgi:anhydro-N-acetylmuramic acid kinase
VSLIASHGHTVFHRPEKNITLQIGDGAEIAAKTGITTVSDFRRFDVALGGQGAPLVPAGDELLFGHYTFCLNLGGFANISFRESGKRLAFDICPVNIVMNRLAREKGLEFDRGGQLAASGLVDPDLLNKIESLDFYNLDGPRSLGKEWVDEVFMPVLECSRAGVADKLRTVCEHIALQIAAVTKEYRKKEKSAVTSSGTDPAAAGSLLITGGGARNDFLSGLIAEKVSPVTIVIPEEELVDYKEAIIFAFLGLLRLRNEVNCLASVTGASRDNCGGIIHLA